MVSDLRRTVPWLETWLLGRDGSQVKVSFTKQLGREGKSGIYYLPRPDIHSSRQGDKKSEFTITLLLICIAGRKCSVLVFLIRYSSQKPVSMFHECAVAVLCNAAKCHHDSFANANMLHYRLYGSCCPPSGA